MGIFTTPKNNLDPQLFGNNQKLHPHIYKRLLHMTYTIIPKEEIEHIYWLGSSIGFTWEADSDIDINIILTSDSMGQKYWHPIVKQINGRLLPGTNHPVNLFVQDYFTQDFEEADFEVYDLTLNKWIHKPVPGSQLPSPSTEKFDMAVAALYESKVKYLIERLKKEPDKMPVLIELWDLFKEVDGERKMVYNYSWGVPRYSIQNIIYKYLDKNDYIHILDELNAALKNE